MYNIYSCGGFNTCRFSATLCVLCSESGVLIGALSSCASFQIPKDPIPKEYIGSYAGDIISANGMAIFTWIAEAKENGEFILNVSKQITKGTIDSDGNFYVKTKKFLGIGLTYKGKVVGAFGMSMDNRLEGKRSK